jgi:tRNA A-37 threonylcarbamoyl transferase component Bud32
MIGPGQELGGYTIIKRIGHGGIGEVYFAQHRRVNRRAAVKVLLPELAQKAAVLEAFFKEARNTSLIRHRGIVEILDCDIVDGQPFVITEFLEGESLGGYLARNGTLENDLAFLLGVMAGVAEAVEAAHVAGIMHRDLKPENIYLHLASPADPSVTVKVLDFGIAKLSREDGGPSQTKTGLWLTQPTYMSPEQCRGSGRTDPRSDIYSLGCVFYEALCGQPPFGSKGIADMIVAHVSQPPKPPVKVVPDLPPKLSSLILRMLAKKPEERPQSMSQVMGTLRDCARALGIDFEGQLQPIVPVVRPTALLGAALASAPAPKPVVAVAASAPPPAVSDRVVVPETFAAPSPPKPLAADAPPAARAAQPAAADRIVTAEMPAMSPLRLRPVEPGTPPVVPAEASAPRPPRAVPKTLLAGVDHRQLIADATAAAAAAASSSPAVTPGTPAPSPSSAEPPIQAFVGGTLFLAPNPNLPERIEPGQRPPGTAIRAVVGGTKIMERFEGPSDDPHAEGDDAGDDAEGDAGGGDSSPGDGRYDRTIKVPSERAAWFGRAIHVLREKPYLLAVIGGGVVVLVAVIGLLVPGGGKGPRTGHVRPRDDVRESSGEPAARQPPEVEPAARPSAATASSPGPPPITPQPPVAPAIAMVQIDIQGLAPDTIVLVDDRPVTLPVRVPRGPELHRFSLRPPSGSERTIEIDGTRDRVIELVMAPERKQAPPPQPAHFPARPHASREHPTPTLAPPAQRPARVTSDRKAITDL